MKKKINHNIYTEQGEKIEKLIVYLLSHIQYNEKWNKEKYKKYEKYGLEMLENIETL